MRKGSVKGIAAFNTLLAMCDTTPLTEGQKADLVIPAYRYIDMLTSGQMQLEEFVSMNQVLCFAHSIAVECEKLATKSAKGQIVEARAAFMQTANALEGIAHRYNKRGVFGANADELAALREFMQWFEPFLDLATKGVLIRASAAAELMIEELFKGQRKCAKS